MNDELKQLANRVWNIFDDILADMNQDETIRYKTGRSIDRRCKDGMKLAKKLEELARGEVQTQELLRSDVQQSE